MIIERAICDVNLEFDKKSPRPMKSAGFLHHGALQVTTISL